MNGFKEMKYNYVPNTRNYIELCCVALLYCNKICSRDTHN